MIACQPSRGMPEPAAPLTAPTRLCFEGDSESESSCHKPTEVEAWLAHPQLTILGSALTPSGLHGARVLTLSVPGAGGARIVFRSKWRAMSTATLTNDPRKELAAYELQDLFLTPLEYVAPPTSGHCFPLEMYREAVDADEPASFGNVDCVFGVLSYWIEDAIDIYGAIEKGRIGPDGGSLVDKELFAESRVYRESLANVNLLSYMIRHGDAHPGQFLMLREPALPRVYSVDNSIALRSVKNPMLLIREDWSLIQVPALPEPQLERLASLTEADFEELLVLQRFERTLDGQLRLAERSGATGNPSEPVSWVGRELVIGMTPSEIDLVARRVRALVKLYRSGELETFGEGFD